MGVPFSSQRPSTSEYTRGQSFSMLLYGMGNGMPLLPAGTLLVGLARKGLGESRQRMLDHRVGLSQIVPGCYLTWTLA